MKLPICTKGQTIQFLINAGLYAASSFLRGSVPSRIDMLDRKTNMLVGAKRSWSAATRVTVVANGLESWTRERTLNQVVAAGPNTAVSCQLQVSPFAAPALIKPTATVTSHARCPDPFVLLKSTLLNSLLSQDISSSKQHLDSAVNYQWWPPDYDVMCVGMRARKVEVEVAKRRA